MENNTKKTLEPLDKQQDSAHAAPEAEIRVPVREEGAPPPEEKAGQTNRYAAKGIDLMTAEEKSFAFLKSLAQASAVFVGFTFIIGWSYLAAYYSTFGLNPLELDLSLPVVCTTAVYLLFNSGWWLFLSAAVWVIALWLASTLFGHHLKVKGLRRSLMATALTLSLFLASLACISLGKRQANEDMLIDSNELPDVAFSTRLTKTDQPDCVDHDTYGSLDCKLLLHSKGTYYFFTPIPSRKDALIDAGNLNVYTLADSDVTGVHILRGLERNVRGK